VAEQYCPTSDSDMRKNEVLGKEENHYPNPGKAVEMCTTLGPIGRLMFPHLPMVLRYILPI
jgi:hypothetical protein